MDILFHKIIDFYFGALVRLGLMKPTWGARETYIWGTTKNFRALVHGCTGKWFWGELTSTAII